MSGSKNTSKTLDLIKTGKIKKWFTLEEAAARLSGSLNEEVTTNDVITLCVENQLPICWYFPALQSVETVNPFYVRNSSLECDSQIEYIPIFHNFYGNEGNEPDKYLNGGECYEIDLANSQSFREHLTHLIAGVTPRSVMDGLILRGDEGEFYRVVEPHYMDAGELVYVPAGFVDSFSRFVIRKMDLNNFERTLLDVKPDQDSMSSRQKNNFLRTIYILTQALIGETSGKLYSDVNCTTVMLAQRGVRPLPVDNKTFKTWLQEGASLLKVMTSKS